jgi:hypothetical protein
MLVLESVLWSLNQMFCMNDETGRLTAFARHSSFFTLNFKLQEWSSLNCFMRSSRTVYSSSRIRLVQARTPS